MSGSLEAIEDEIAKLPQDEVTVNVIHRGVGGINESDVMLAAASDGDHPRLQRAPGRRRPRRRPSARAWRSAPTRSSTARSRSCARHGGHARARGGRGRPSARSRCARSSGPRGSARSPARYVTEGKVTRGAKVRLVRDGTVVYDGEIASLRRFNDDVREVAGGLRVRHRAQGLPGRQGRRRARGLRATRKVERALS